MLLDRHEHVVRSFDYYHQALQATWLFEEFVRDCRNKFDITNSKGMQEVFAAAKKRGIYEAASEIRELIFDRNISVYGVSYISNVCDEKCAFCPMGQSCLRAEKIIREISKSRSSSKRAVLEEKLLQVNSGLRTLSVEEAQEDFNAVTKLGHTELCLLTGSGLCTDYRKLIPYVRAALTTKGVREVILNVAQFTESVFLAFMEDLQDGFVIPDGVILQYRIFQETYDREVYAEMMRSSDPIHGKGNYDVRYDSHFAVLRASETLRSKGLRGVDEVGLGVLFGLSARPMDELWKLYHHSRKFGFNPSGDFHPATHSAHGLTGDYPVFRVCLPFANEPKGCGVEIPHNIIRRGDANKIIELIYALARLALPYASIVSSERDSIELLRKLDRYANHTTLGVHPYPGGNIDALADLEGRSQKYLEEVPQADTHPRDVAETLRRWKKDGWNVINFNHTINNEALL